MTRRGDRTEAFAIVRRDHFPGHDHDPDSFDPPMICGGEFSYTVKEVVLDRATAEREVDRLNRLNAEKDCRYFWQYTRLYLDGGADGEAPPERGAR